MLFPGKVEAVTFISSDCVLQGQHCLPFPALLNEWEQDFARQNINIFARAQLQGIFYLRFGFPLLFCQLACLTAMLLSSFAKEYETGHTVSSLEAHFLQQACGKADSSFGGSYYLLSSSYRTWQRLNTFGCVGFWMEVRNPNLSDTTHGEGQYFEAAFNGGMQGVQSKKCVEAEERSRAGMKWGKKGMTAL